MPRKIRRRKRYGKIAHGKSLCKKKAHWKSLCYKSDEKKSSRKRTKKALQDTALKSPAKNHTLKGPANCLGKIAHGKSLRKLPNKKSVCKIPHRRSNKPPHGKRFGKMLYRKSPAIYRTEEAAAK